MKKISTLSATSLILLIVAFIAYSCSGNNKPQEGETKADLAVSGKNDAFLNHRDSVPSPQQYSDSLFKLSHDYPTTFKPVINPSWQKALNGQPISDKNAIAYMDSLKSYVAPNVLPFFSDNKNWTSAKYGWFNEPWVGAQREAILGTYLGNGNPANMFKTLKEDEAGYALVLYDSVAAYTVGQIWGKTGQKVNLANDAAQFKEGSVIVKFAFSNVNYPQWPVMKNAQTFSVYDTIPTKENPKKGYQVRKVSFFQMDIIVKDSKTSPKTGWVYSTFVYDMDAPGSGWDKMVPLGAMWGDDPGINSPLIPPYPKLAETVINPKAPAYSTETLGWGGRLSGPNDGAVAQVAFDINSGKKYTNLALSSCMSCHSPAQDSFNSFLLPGPFPSSDSLKVYTPGSPNWNLWFQDNYGNVPFDKGQVAMDYDMVMAFKSVLAYQAAHPSAQSKLLQTKAAAVARFRRHNTNSRFWH
ncbi:hypothetical protein [Mucilaginibacter sp. OK283]|jgi:hypothetical protein|uniref:hypothetical protein n=1 Tax=Mucilaginibacter sp. OK283 TaxID=1881049 RepID=UPI0008AD2448|nr:hypothetical protein [Mucilaginibacter sp. OK283]SEO44395.1 hypothetical protein SAMN05428947_102385 [Mucilaginibacter sp. OK283]